MVVREHEAVGRDETPLSVLKSFRKVVPVGADLLGTLSCGMPCKNSDDGGSCTFDGALKSGMCTASCAGANGRQSVTVIIDRNAR
ncbi:MAG: hypothetical protein ACLTMP_10260 [Eggerthella lenta]